MALCVLRLKEWGQNGQCGKLVLNTEADNLVHYAKCHNLRINAAKTQAIIIGNNKILMKLPDELPSIIVDGSPISYSDTVNDLGVLIDKHLNWNEHVTFICRKAYASLYGIKRHSYVLSPLLRKRLVEALVFPVFDYGCIVTSNMLVDSALKLQRVQNACARLIFNLRRDCHISGYISNLNWLNISNRSIFASVTLLKKVLSANSPQYLADSLNYSHDVRSRIVRGSKFHLWIPQHRTDKGRGAFWINAPIMWNKLPDSILRISNFKTFKSHLKIYLLRRQ